MADAARPKVVNDKLSDETILRLVRLYENTDWTISEIAKECGVSYKAARKYIDRHANNKNLPLTPKEKMDRWAKALHGSLKATDRRFNHSVHLVHQDGSTLFFNHAFIQKWPADNHYLGIFTEHHGFYWYSVDDLVDYSELKQWR